MENKEKQHLNCVNQLKRLQNYEKGGAGGPEEKIITITEMRSGRLYCSEIDLINVIGLVDGARRKSYVPEDRDLTEQEQSALDGMKQRDKQIVNL